MGFIAVSWTNDLQNSNKFPVFLKEIIEKFCVTNRFHIYLCNQSVTRQKSYET
jgi:hypothetical protein